MHQTKKVTELKKLLGFHFKEDLERISPRYNWRSIKCNEKSREMVLTASADDPEIAALMGLIKTINNSISNNRSGCDIKMRLAIYSLTNFTGVA